NGCADGDQTCRSTCASQHPTGTPLFNAIPPCLNAHCTAACSGGAPGISGCFSTSAFATCNAYCTSVHKTCATTCAGANGGFTPGQAGLGYYDSSDCQTEVSAGVLVGSCTQTFLTSNSPWARCCCM